VPETVMHLSRFLERERARNALPAPEISALIDRTAFASKVVAREIRRAALVGKLGLVGEKNPSGEVQKKLDVYANEVFLEGFEEIGLVAGMVSEEIDDLRVFNLSPESGYLLCTDPLDGSSNTEVNGALGTIFGFFRRERHEPCRDIAEEMAEGLELQVAGYVLYGASTVLVLAYGNTVVEFTLDHDLGTFLLSNSSLRCPERGSTLSVNMGYYHRWSEGVRAYVDHLVEPDPETGRPYTCRYSGALVADLHRILIKGGIYLYPEDSTLPKGKLRLLYECAPLGFVVERAGGRASDGRQRILEVVPDVLHQRTPLAIGSREDVAQYEEFRRTRD